MWFYSHSQSSTLCSFISLFMLLCFVAAHEVREGGLNVAEGYDCSNKTHSWKSQHNSCLLDAVVDETSANKKQDLLDSQKATGRFIGGLGLRPRQSECAANQTRCWIVNCCDPGQICGPINVGCTYSYSTIYTTTTTSVWSTLTSLVIPGGVSYATAQVTETAYSTTWKSITLPGAGQNTVLQTTTTTTTQLILSAYTPPPVRITETVSSDPQVTNAPKFVRDASNIQLPHAEIPRQVDSVRYTTITVYVQQYFTSAVASTLSSDAVLTFEKTTTISSIATQNQTFYRTPTAFVTSMITETITSKSYAYGSLAPATQTISVTPSAPSSEVAGTTPPTGSDPNQSNPPGAYPPSGKHGLSSGAIAGLVVGIILALILIALLVVIVCCVRRKRNRRAGYDREVRNSRHLVDAPSPPSPPVPQMAMVSSSSPHSSDESPSPPAEGGIMRSSHRSGSNLRYGHGRKSSRSSVVSITPVPEEDEEDLEQERMQPVAAGVRRNSGDSTRSWGRGYGGRGGYYGGAGGRTRNTDSSSPTHHTFRGQTITSYSDESLVPPHARGSQERL